MTDQVHKPRGRRRRRRVSTIDFKPITNNLAKSFASASSSSLFTITTNCRQLLNPASILTIIFLSLVLIIKDNDAQLVQRNYLVPGHNMENLRISELQPVGSIVYQLKAIDQTNENRKITYAMTGDTFSVDEETGEVRLIKQLDRERQSQISTVVNVLGTNSDQPLESRRRVIIIEDIDDSWPIFAPHKSSVFTDTNKAHYVFRADLNEQVPIGGVVISELHVNDADEGSNAEVAFECRPKLSSSLACEHFSIESRRLQVGKYSLTIRTKALLDFEQIQSYKLILVARGRRPSPLKGTPLEAEAIVNINLINIQDEGPIFVNAPYSLSMHENLKPGTRLLSLIVQDGDLAPQRELSMIIVPGTFSEYFQVTKDPELAKIWYLETNTTIDRENSLIRKSGSMFTISLLAAELDDSGSPIASEPELLAAMRDSIYSKGTLKKENVTIVVLDLPDSSPMFIQASTDKPIVNNFLVVNISESLVTGASIPNLDLAVLDLDQGINSRYKLSLTDADVGPQASAAFTLESELIYGKAEVVLNVLNSSLIDYEDPSFRVYRFSLVASKNQETPLVQILEVQINIMDANDNVPEFDRDQFVVEVPEGSPPGKFVAAIQAKDRDSGIYGKIDYMLRGAGASKFKLISNEGKIIVNDCGVSQCLDYETQPSFSLIYEARDGGGLVKNVSVIISVTDINDHAPKFTELIYKRELISDNLISKHNYILPQLVVQARDGDGPTQGRNNITYKIKSSNLTGLDVEPNSGLVYISQPVDLDNVISNMKYPSNDNQPATDRKIVFEAEVVAEDNGIPPQNSTATILLVVKGNQDGAPLFKQDIYQAFVRENQPTGKPFFQVKAIDPDDKDSQLRYSLGYDLNDLISIDSITGELAFKNEIDFDDFKGVSYNVTVHATDNNTPYPLKATAMVSILIQDVNDVAPKFDEKEYKTTLIQGRTKPGDVILQVKATDLDKNAHLNYSLISGSLSINDRNGQEFGIEDIAESKISYLSHVNKVDRLRLVNDLKKLFAINRQTGIVTLNYEPDYSFAASITINARVVDLNQEVFNQSGEVQQDFAHCTFFLQTHVDKTPLFAPPWSIDKQDYNISILEELNIGSQIFSFLAKDPITGNRIETFEKLFDSDPRDYFRVDKSGAVLVNRRIDYEELPHPKRLFVSVKALNNDAIEFSLAHLNVQIIDLNDNAPQFKNQTYYATISELINPNQEILVVQAEDKDTGDFGQVYYHIIGYTSDLFTIHPRKGAISLKKSARLDRETEINHHLMVVATDCNETKIAAITSEVQLMETSTQSTKLDNRNSGSNCRKSSALVIITLIDENDNDPIFINVNKRGEFEATTSETVSIGTVVAQAIARDADDGLNGQVNYEIIRGDDQISRLLTVDSEGFIRTVSSLSGLGRSLPYAVNLRALDLAKTNNRQAYATLLLSINDVVSNDGVPKFIRPKPDEVITLSENVGPSTFVYQVQAIDPDEESSGKLMYKFIQPSDTFEIDPFEGVIKTQHRAIFFLDREKIPEYTLIIVAQDLGSPPKQAHQVLTIKITDINDNDPEFERDIDDMPIVLQVDEELPKDSLIGTIQAVDRDEGQNALIGYEIIEGNQNNLFRLDWELLGEANNSSAQKNVGNNPCRIYSNNRLDRETKESYTLTIRATSMSKLRNQFFFARDPLGGRSPFEQYNASDLTKIRVLIKLMDINDNRPVFIHQHAKSVVDSSADTYSQLMVLQAIDLDSSSSEIQYSILDVLYYSDSKFSKPSSMSATAASIKSSTNHDDSKANRMNRYQYNPGNSEASLRYVFDIDSRTGILRNSVPLRPFIDGYFEVFVKADSGFYNQQLAANDQFFNGSPSKKLPDTINNKCRQNDGTSNGTYNNSNLPSNGESFEENCNIAIAKAIIFVTHQREAFRFVFDKTRLNDRLDEFKEKIQSALEGIMFEPTKVQASSFGDARLSLNQDSNEISSKSIPSRLSSSSIGTAAERVYLNTFNTDFYEREDGSLDFSTITSCSQLVKFDDRSKQQDHQQIHQDSSNSLVPNQVVEYNEVLNLLKTLNNTQVLKLQQQQQKLTLFNQYGLVKIERCSPDKTMYKMTLAERLAIYYAIGIAVAGLFLALIVSNMRKKYERNLKLLQRSKYQYMSPYA